nr:EOG090X0ECZ [Sida crystallina]
MSAKHRVSDGDWTCPDSSCANVNFARRTECNRCGKPREDEKARVKKLGVEIGKEAAEKSKGLFSADDWMCNKCGNVNWARRSQCNVCNAPRFGEVEERTGYGGGYNERENVEYIERKESDDEFDEFGRRKKKFRKNPSEEPTTSKKKTEIKSDDEEDEEEEDDGDLSKYDLSGWGDESNDKDDEGKKASDEKHPKKSESSRDSRAKKPTSK